MEAAYHIRFYDCRIGRSEWFSPSQELLAHIGFGFVNQLFDMPGYKKRWGDVTAHDLAGLDSELWFRCRAGFFPPDQYADFARFYATWRPRLMEHMTIGGYVTAQQPGQ